MWLIAYCFPDMEIAGRAYKRARDVVFGRDIDASVYRVQIGGVPHLIALGDGAISEELRQRFEGTCSKGKLAEVAPEISKALSDRRKANKLPGFFWEANYHQGQTP